MRPSPPQSPRASRGLLVLERAPEAEAGGNTRFTAGDGLRMAIEIGAMPYGKWSGCHAVG